MTMVFFWAKDDFCGFFWGAKYADGVFFFGKNMVMVGALGGAALVFACSCILTHSGCQLIEFTVVKGSFYI